jgi:hypothetical protein
MAQSRCAIANRAPVQHIPFERLRKGPRWQAWYVPSDAASKAAYREKAMCSERRSTGVDRGDAAVSTECPKSARRALDQRNIARRHSAAIWRAIFEGVRLGDYDRSAPVASSHQAAGAINAQEIGDASWLIFQNLDDQSHGPTRSSRPLIRCIFSPRNARVLPRHSDADAHENDESDPRT